MRAGREALLPEAPFFFFGLAAFFFTAGFGFLGLAGGFAGAGLAGAGRGGLFPRGRRLLAGDSGPGVLARRGRRFLLLPGAFLGLSLGIRHARGQFLVRDDRRLRKTLRHDVQSVRGHAEQIDRRVARLLGLRQIVGGLQGMRWGLREVDGNRVRLLSFRQLEEGRPPRLRRHDVRAGPGELLHPRVAFGPLEIEKEDAHEEGDFSRCQGKVSGKRQVSGIRCQVSG